MEAFHKFRERTLVIIDSVRFKNCMGWIRYLTLSFV